MYSLADCVPGCFRVGQSLKSSELCLGGKLIFVACQMTQILH